MSNCCFVNHVITPVDHSEAAMKQLTDCLKVLSAYNTTFAKDPNHSALWHIVADFNGVKKANDTNCRSAIIGIAMHDASAPYGRQATKQAPYDGISIEEQTANKPCTEAWDAVMSAFPLLRRSWCSSTPDDHIYLKHDPDGKFFSQKKYVVETDAVSGEDATGSGVTLDYECMDTSYLVRFLRETFGINTAILPVTVETALADAAMRQATEVAEARGQQLELYLYREV